MPTVKEKIKTKVEQAKVKTQDFIKDKKLDEKLNKLQEKVQPVLAKVKDKFEKSGLKEKAKSLVKDENKQKVKDLAKKGVDRTKVCATKLKEKAKKDPKKAKIVGAVVAVIAIMFVTSVCSDERHFSYEVNGLKKEMTYYFDEAKVYGEVFDLKSQTYATINPVKFMSGVIGLNVVGVSDNDYFIHEASDTSLKDVAYTITVKDPIFGSSVYFVFKKDEFEFYDNELDGFSVYAFTDKQRYKPKEPDFKFIYTKYDN